MGKTQEVRRSPPGEEVIEVVIPEGSRVAHIPSVRLVNPAQAKDLVVEVTESPAAEIVSKPTDITMDTPVGEVTAAVRRGDFTLDDVRAQVPRLDAEVSHGEPR